jgi:hypothetical protein
MGAARGKRQVNIGIDSLVYDNLARRAGQKGLPVATYALQLFEAAYAARIGREKQLPVSDDDLDEQVRAVFCLAGEFKPDAIARALGLSLSLVDKILAGWKQQRGLA